MIIVKKWVKENGYRYNRKMSKELMKILGDLQDPKVEDQTLTAATPLGRVKAQLLKGNVLQVVRSNPVEEEISYYFFENGKFIQTSHELVWKSEDSGEH